MFLANQFWNVISVHSIFGWIELKKKDRYEEKRKSKKKNVISDKIKKRGRKEHVYMKMRRNRVYVYKFSSFHGTV